MRGLSDSGEVAGNSVDYDPVVWDSNGLRKVLSFPYELEYQVVGSHYWKRMKEKDALTGHYTGNLLDEYHRFDWDEVIPASAGLTGVEAHSISPNGKFILADGTYEVWRFLTIVESS